MIGDKVRILTGITGHKNRVGEIIYQNEYSIRVAFPEFWTRPDGMSPEEANDNGWFFHKECVIIKGDD